MVLNLCIHSSISYNYISFDFNHFPSKSFLPIHPFHLPLSHPFIHLFIHPFIHLIPSIHSSHPSIHLSHPINPSIYPFMHPSMHPHILSIYPSHPSHPSIYPSIHSHQTIAKLSLRSVSSAFGNQFKHFSSDIYSLLPFEYNIFLCSLSRILQFC